MLRAVLWVLIVSGFFTGLYLVWSWARVPDPPRNKGGHDQL